MSKIEVNTVDVKCGSTLTLGSSGKTVTIASGASTSGMGRSGTVDWQTSSIKTDTFTASDGEGYFVDTSDGSPFKNYAVTVTTGTLYIVGGSGNIYHLDGSQQTAITMLANKTYRFTQSDSSNNGHQLIISTSNSTTLGTFQAGIVSSGITYYIDGSATQSNWLNSTTFNAGTTRYVEFKPSTTGTYYFGCYNHGIGMGGAITVSNQTVNLPAGTAGSIVSIQDYKNNFDTNALTIDPNGSEKINGGDPGGTITLDTEARGITLVYVDSTIGWRSVSDNEFQKTSLNPAYIAATGGNATLTNGDFKTHVFTAPGTFCVSAGAGPIGIAEYMIVAGGGGAENYGGGGAGGFRSTIFDCIPSPTTTPLASPTKLSITAGAYPVAVGGGGAGAETQGSVSSFSTISSAGGGGGRSGPNAVGQDGGSGGGGRGAPAYPGAGYPGGTGNQPPVTPSQGNPGGAGFDGISVSTNGGAGGGAGASGGDGSANNGGVGGVGSYIADTVFGPTAPSYGTSGPVSSTRYFSGGGAGGSNGGGTKSGGSGGGGGSSTNGTSGTTNTGGGSGAGNGSSSTGTGGSGIVVIRYRYQ